MNRTIIDATHKFPNECRDLKFCRHTSTLSMYLPIPTVITASVGILQSSGILIETLPSVFVRRVKHGRISTFRE